ncbi:MAG TPA: hypothetical protein VGB64_05455 [Actinomycetota bacterium]
MHRTSAAALLVALLLSGMPARAETVNGTIMLPDFGSPSIGRLLYSETGTTGMVGYVFRLAAKTSFSLVKTSTPTGLESFDIFFYDEVGGKPGNSLNPIYNACPSQDPFCNKAGPIPAGAKWAVVSLVLGVNGSFRYTST